MRACVRVCVCVCVRVCVRVCVCVCVCVCVNVIFSLLCEIQKCMLSGVIIIYFNETIGIQRHKHMRTQGRPFYTGRGTLVKTANITLRHTKYPSQTHSSNNR